MSTVGFGDIVPHTEAGRFIVIALIIVSVILIPMQSAKLNEILSQRSGADLFCFHYSQQPFFLHWTLAVVVLIPFSVLRFVLFLHAFMTLTSVVSTYTYSSRWSL